MRVPRPGWWTHSSMHRLTQELQKEAKAKKKARAYALYRTRFLLCDQCQHFWRETRFGQPIFGPIFAHFCHILHLQNQKKLFGSSGLSFFLGRFSCFPHMTWFVKWHWTNVFSFFRSSLSMFYILYLTTKNAWRNLWKMIEWWWRGIQNFGVSMADKFFCFGRKSLKWRENVECTLIMDCG